MSQEYNTVPKKQRRPRSQRNRPTLVTGTHTSAAQELSAAEEQAAQPVTTITEPTPAAPAPRQRSSLLPRFFSKVDKGEQEESGQKANVIEARMARARKGFSFGGKAADKQEEPAAKESTKAATSTSAPAKATPNRPPSLFKTRHIAGMAIYLLAAQIVLPYERVFAINIGIEQKLAEFPFFGFNASITTSFLLNIITLVVLLYALVRFDLLPTGKKLAAAQQAQGARRTSSGTTPAEKVPPKTMREGVKGEHDDLYMAYRSNQRREKKR